MVRQKEGQGRHPFCQANSQSARLPKIVCKEKELRLIILIDLLKNDNDDKDFKYRHVPDSNLSEYIDVFPRGRVVDFGMGEGRNAFYRIGFKNVKLFGYLAETEYGMKVTRWSRSDANKSGGRAHER